MEQRETHEKEGRGENPLPSYKGCFFCGREHPAGLRLKLYHRDGNVSCDFSIDETFQGYDDIAHGGIVMGILDEVMWWAVTVGSRKITATRKFDIEFVRPMLCATPYRASGRLERERHGLYFASASIEDRSGRFVARAGATFMPAKNMAGEQFVKNFDLSRVSEEMRELFLSLGIAGQEKEESKRIFP